MLNREDYKLGRREIVSLVLLLVGAKLSDMTPSLMFDETEMASWIALLLSAGLFFLSFSVFLQVAKHYPQKGLMELFDEVLGKYIGFAMGFILLFIMIAANIADTRTTVGIISTLYFPETPILILYIMLTSICLFIARRGLEAIGRTAVLFIVWVKLIILLLVVMIWKKLNFSFLFPILGREPERILLTGFKFMPIFAEIMLITVFMHFLRSYEDYKKSSLLGLFIVTIELVSFWLFYIMTYDVPIIKEVTYMFHESTRIVSVGRFLTNPETIFLPIWLIAIFVRFAFYLYLTTAIFAYLFKINEFEPLLLPMATFIIACGILPENAIQAEYVIRETIVFQYGSFFFFFFPFLLWIVHKRKEKQA